MALCSDLLVVEDKAEIGYPPARVWGVSTTALGAPDRRRAQSLSSPATRSGRAAIELGARDRLGSAEELDAVFNRCSSASRGSRSTSSSCTSCSSTRRSTRRASRRPRSSGTFFDGIGRYTAEGHEFVRKAATDGFREAVRERDEPYGDYGLGGATGGDGEAEWGPCHKLADAVRARDRPQARRRRPHRLRRRRQRPVAGSHSKYVERHFVTASPRGDTLGFVADVERICSENEVDVVVPAFEEAFYLATQAERLANVTRCSRRSSRRSRASMTSRPSRHCASSSACRCRRRSSRRRPTSCGRRPRRSRATSAARRSPAAASSC